MLISELRELLKKYKDEDLRLLISEMYKCMPKRVRKDKDIDRMLEDIHRYMNIRKVRKKQDEHISMDDLKREIDQFIEYAYKQYYFAPNSYVHKKERPKWRFKVKRYIKDLQVITVEGKDGEIATNLLQKLYEMLCYACDYYIFSTDNPFRSVGIEQTVLLDIVISRKLGLGMNKGSVKSVVEVVINSRVNRETLHSSLIMVLVKNLKSPDSKEIAIEQCMIFKNQLEESKPVTSKKSWGDDSFNYQRKEKINNLVEMIFRLNMELCEYDKAISYFKANNVEHNNEVSLYVLLRLLLEYELREHWLKEYSDALSKGVKPREALQKTHKYIQENESLPEYILY